MPDPSTNADVEARWRPLVGQEVTNCTTLRADAWRMLKRRIPTLEADIATDADLSAETVRVIATAVLRVLKNPDGLSSESVDDYTYKRDGSAADGVLHFTDDELGALLDDPAEGARGRAFEIDLLAGRTWE